MVEIRVGRRSPTRPTDLLGTKVKKWKSFKRDRPSLQYTTRGFSVKDDGVLRLAGGIRVNVV
jgi:hypothetical protein